MTPDDVEALFREQASSEGEAAVVERTERLQGALEILMGLSRSHQPELTSYVGKLANGGRDSSWRIPLGESGIVDFVTMSLVGEDWVGAELRIHCLRLIGNSCADTDENRARVVQAGAMSTLMGFLSNPDLLPYALAVIYNTMADYAPAQLQASKQRLSTRLVDILSGPDPAAARGQINLICKILSLLISQEPEPANANQNTPLTLLNLAQDPSISEDLDDLFSAVSVAQEYLSHEPVQTPFITSQGTPTFLNVFEKLHGTQYDPDSLDDEDLASQITVLRKVLINALADITDNPAFAETHPIGSPTFDRLRGWLDSDKAELKAAACLALGNLSRSDEASLAFVNERSLHVPLVRMLEGAEDSLPLHSALSFLRNLAIPPKNRGVLGPMLLKEGVLPRIWGLETLPQVQLAAASVTRLLVVGNADNAAILLTPLEAGSDKTYLHGVLGLFSRTDDPAKMEAARAVLAALRTLATTDPGPGSVDVERVYRDHGDLEPPITHLLTQEQFPPLRSETFFVLGLLTSRSPEAIPMIQRLLGQREVLGVIKGAIQGSLPEAKEVNPLEEVKPRDPRGEGALRADRENCLVVVSGVRGEVRDEGLKRELGALMKEGEDELGKV